MPGRSSVETGRQVDALAGAEPAQVPHRPVQHRVAGLAVRAGDRLGEVHDVLVGEQVEVGVEVRLVGELDRPEPLPAGQVGGDGEGRLRAEGAVRDVGHHVAAEAGYPGDARVLHSGVGLAALPAGVGGEHHAAPLDAGGHAVVEDHLGEPDAGDVARGDQPRQQVQGSVGGAARGRVQDALRFEGSPGRGDITTPSRVSR